MGGGSHCWVTCLSLGLPGALSSLSQLRPHPSHTPAAPTETRNPALPTCSSLAPPLSPQPLSSRVRLQLASQLLPRRGTSGVPPPFFLHLAPPTAPPSPLLCISTGWIFITLHPLDFHSCDWDRELSVSAVAWQRGWAAPDENLDCNRKGRSVDSGQEGRDLGEPSGGLEAGGRGRSPAWGPSGSSLTSEALGMMTFVPGAVSAAVDLGPDPSWQLVLLPWGGVGSDRGTTAREDIPARSVGAQNYSYFSRL